MKSFLNWLAGLFRVEKTWVARGQGKWVLKRHIHPVTQVLIVTALTFCISWGVNFFSPEEPPPKERDKPESSPRGTDSRELSRVPVPVERDPTGLVPSTLPSFDLTSFDPDHIPNGVDPKEDERWIRISKRTYHLYLYRGHSVESSFDIAVGMISGDKQQVGDNRTPEGVFRVQSIENASAWSHDFRDGNGVIRGAYGPWFIRLRAKNWRGIGIHGTHDPESIGTMVSEGCIRMQNEELEMLKQVARKNMKVVIEE
ncbi:MAG: L,D-transpeptidase [Synergistaceae bacterium]|jgi:hypothetical protein|nr:L,D-transpeptidase [Synergistaceae bacterium]